jgi:hypothetical protein
MANNFARRLNSTRFDHAVNFQLHHSSAKEGFAAQDADALLHKFGLK